MAGSRRREPLLGGSRNRELADSEFAQLAGVPRGSLGGVRAVRSALLIRRDGPALIVSRLLGVVPLSGAALVVGTVTVRYDLSTGRNDGRRARSTLAPTPVCGTVAASTRPEDDEFGLQLKNRW